MPITQHDRDLLEDLQLRDNDHTDEVVGAKERAPGAGGNRPEGDVSSNRIQRKETTR